MPPGFNLALPGIGSLGLNMAGMPMGGFNPSATSGMDMSGASWAMGGGDWNVNLAGSGAALQTATSMPWLLILAVAAGVILWKR